MNKIILLMVLILIASSCTNTTENEKLEMENRVLKREIDSLRNELYKCDMMLDVYEGLPMDV